MNHMNERPWFLRFTVHVVSVFLAALPTLLSAVEAQQQPTFRSGVNYVSVDVVVTDTDDRPITDLTAADFQILEKGRPQKIVSFERVSTPTANRPVDLRAEPLPPADVGSNAPPPRDSRAIVIFVGPFSTADLVPLKQLLTEFISLLQPEDTVALTYAQRSDLGQDFTNDVGRLAKAVDNATAAAGGFIANLDVTVKNLIDVLVAAPHARKAIFFVSQGVQWVVSPDAPRDSRGRPSVTATEARMRAGDFADRWLDILGQARRANVPLYTIDPHGLASPESVSNIGEIASPGAREGLVRLIQQRHDFLHVLAANTGGRSFVNQSSLARAAREIVTENGSYYLLGYYPDPWVGDGQFHPIDVKVTRPGVRVRARAGYMTEVTVPKALARPPRLVSSLRDGVAGGDLMLKAVAAPVAPTRSGARTYLTLDVIYPEAAGERPRPDDRLEIAWVALDPDARILASGEETLRVPLAKIGREAFTLSVNQLIDAPRGKTVLRVAASSEALGTRGRVHMPLDVPRLADQPLALAPLVIAASADRSIRVANIGKTDNVLPFQPTTRRIFENRESVGVYARVFAAAPTGMTAELRLKLNGTVQRTLPIALKPVTGERQAIEGQIGVPLAGLEPGEWVFEVIARASTELTATRGVVIKIR
jgi:VWFA-related protein